MPEISVIIPVYNPQEEYLKNCLDSICSQTFKNIEIIVVDNASIGNNSAILREYALKDDRIILIKNKQNRGFSGACNQALRQSSAPYIQIVDSDDFLENNCLEILYNKMSECPDCDLLLFCAYEYHMQTNQDITNAKYDYLCLRQKIGNRPFVFEQVVKELLGSSSQAWNKFYRKSLIFDNDNFFDEDFVSFGTDTLFSYYNYLNARQIRLIPDRLYHYRFSTEAGVMSALSQKDCSYYLAPIKLVKKIDDIAIKYPKYFEQFKVLNLLILKTFFEKIHHCNQKNYFNKMKDYLLKYPYNDSIVEKSDTKDFHNSVLKNNYFIYKLKNFYRRLHYATFR